MENWRMMMMMMMIRGHLEHTPVGVFGLSGPSRAGTRDGVDLSCSSFQAQFCLCLIGLKRSTPADFDSFCGEF